jgi:aminoglycoside phosphotransferase (APT) family kinase protein
LTAADLGRREPARARDAGLICGQVHARLPGVSAPAELRAVPGAPASAARQPGGRAPPVLHLDLHPFNVLLGGDGALAGVLDWANAAAGHPVFDRARTWAILTLDPTARARRADPGWRLLCEGWVAAGGPRRRPGAGARLGV